MRADQFVDDETHFHAALGLVPEQFVRQFRARDVVVMVVIVVMVMVMVVVMVMVMVMVMASRALRVALHLLRHLLLQRADFAFDHRLRQLHFVQSLEFVHDLTLHLISDRGVEFALHVAAHFGAKRFDAALFDVQTS